MTKINNDAFISMLKKTKLTIKGLLVTQETSTFVFNFTLANRKITGAVKAEDLGGDGVGITVRFAICSSEDEFESDLGADIAIGRVFRAEGNDAIVAGNIGSEDAMMSVLKNKVKALEKALTYGDDVRKQIARTEDMVNANTKRKLIGLI